MQKIVVAQFYTNNLSYGKFSEEINKKYCSDKGYVYHVEKDTDKIKGYIEDRAYTWAKPKLIAEVMQKYDCDYVLFLDMDAIVSDHTIRIEEFIDDHFDLVATEDYSSHSKMNAGVLLFKNSEWSKNFLNDWWEAGDYLRGNDCPALGTNSNQEGYYKNGLWHDQTCLTILYDRNSNIRNKIKIITNRSLNWREYNDNNFIFHAFGYGNIKNRKIDTAYYKIFNIKIDSTNKSLLEISDFYPTDKESEHQYISYHYEKLFEPIRNTTKRFCEIGVGNLGSVKMWRDYFPNCKVVACDINSIENDDKERIEIVKLDQSKEEELDDFCKNQENFDVILDDGSHKMRDQQITFAKLFKKLNPNGIFIIEDLHTSVEAKMPEKRGFNWGDPDKTTLDMLENFIKTGKIVSDYISDQDTEYLEQNIEICRILRKNNDYWSVTSVIKKKIKSTMTQEFNHNSLLNSSIKSVVKRAVYGDKDVTDIVNNKLINGDSSLMVGRDLFGDQFLEVTYCDGKVVKVPEGEELIFPQYKTIVTPEKHETIYDVDKIEHVEKAVYGGKDVTDIVNEKIKKGDLFLRIGNDTFGDPDPGVLKHLEITYNGQTSTIPENQIVVLNKNMVEDDTEKKKTIVVVVFCYAINDWRARLENRINRIVKSGLYEEADEIYLVIVDTNEQEKNIEELMVDYKKIIVERHTENQPECKGIQKIDDIGKSRNNVNLFYSHIKGVFNNFKNFQTKEISEQKIKSGKDWVESLEYFTIDNWRDCVQKLNDGFDTVGVTNNGGWWWGNFWWVRSSHIKKNSEFKCRDRWYAEAWLHDGNINPNEIKKYEMCHYEFDPQGSDFPRFFYDGSYLFSGKTIEVVSAFFGCDGVQRDEAQPALKENLVDVTEKIKNMILDYSDVNFIADDQSLSISDPAITSLGPVNKCLYLNYRLPDISDKIFRLKTFSGWRTKIGWPVNK